jgi:hypothetical protein
LIVKKSQKDQRAQLVNPDGGVVLMMTPLGEVVSTVW